MGYKWADSAGHLRLAASLVACYNQFVGGEKSSAYLKASASSAAATEVADCCIIYIIRCIGAVTGWSWYFTHQW